MAEGTAIIVGGGITAGTPFTERRYVIITEDDPATIAAGRLRQLVDTFESILAPGPSGGVNSFTLGEGADDRGADRVVLIGRNVRAAGGSGGAQGDDCVYIGDGIDAGAAGLSGTSTIAIGRVTFGSGGSITSGGSSVLIGFPVTLGGVDAGNNVAIGQNVTVTTGGGSVCIGQGSSVSTQSVSIGAGCGCAGAGVAVGNNGQANGTDSVGVGRNVRANGARNVVLGSQSQNTSADDVTIVGNSASAPFAGAIALGAGAAGAAANHFQVGGVTSATWITIARIGPGSVAGYPGLSWFHPSAGPGTDQASPHVTWRGGLATGNAAGGEHRFQTSSPLASGSTFQAAVERFAVIASTGLVNAPTLRLSNITPTVVVGDDYLPVTINANTRFVPALVAAGVFGTIQIQEATDPTLRFVETAATPEWQLRATPADFLVEAITADGTISLVPDSGGEVSARADVSATAGNVRLLVWDVTAAALVRVSRGAADSGGAGFRLLRIPN